MTTAWSAPPAQLAGALAALSEGARRGELRERAQRISEGFRAGGTSSETIREEADALAYALTRLPATYAATAFVLRKLREELPDFAPNSLLDAGCGPGGGAAAALETFPQIDAVALFDRNPPFLALARRLAIESAHVALKTASFFTGDLSAPSEELARAELVLASYALTELPDAALPAAIDALWARTLGALVVIEPGAPRDHARLMGLRARLIALGGFVALPCPHQKPCPLIAPDWCHFSARLPRSRDHKSLKSADAPFEDEKFGYLIVTRLSHDQSQARLIKPPRAAKWGIRLRFCSASGIGETNIAKRDKSLYRILRNKTWGDSIAPIEDSLP